MHSVVKFRGMLGKILKAAVKKGIASSQVEAVRLGVLELNNRYGLIKGAEGAEDVLDLAEARRMMKLVEEGKMPTFSEKEFRRIVGR